MAAENCDLQDGDVVAVWGGCGPVGQFAIRSAFMLGAGRVIAIDRFPARLALARKGNAETINYEEVDDVVEELKELTGESALIPVSMPSDSKLTAIPRMLITIALNRPGAWLRTGSPRYARPSKPAANAGQYQSPASTADLSTKCRWAPRLEKD